jgi:DNA-binding MarR family transcriptional regulator
VTRTHAAQEDEALVVALLTLTDPALVALREVARRQLATAPPTEPALALLRAVSRFPGLSRPELAERTGLAPDMLVRAADELLAKGLATSQRFERSDCWSRTTAGAAVLRSTAGGTAPAVPAHDPAGRLQR